MVSSLTSSLWWNVAWIHGGSPSVTDKSLSVNPASRRAGSVALKSSIASRALPALASRRFRRARSEPFLRFADFLCDGRLQPLGSRGCLLSRSSRLLEDV